MRIQENYLCTVQYSMLYWLHNIARGWLLNVFPFLAMSLYKRHINQAFNASFAFISVDNILNVHDCTELDDYCLVTEKMDIDTQGVGHCSAWYSLKLLLMTGPNICVLYM